MSDCSDPSSCGSNQIPPSTDQITISNIADGSSTPTDPFNIDNYLGFNGPATAFDRAYFCGQTFGFPNLAAGPQNYDPADMSPFRYTLSWKPYCELRVAGAGERSSG